MNCLQDSFMTLNNNNSFQFYLGCLFFLIYEIYFLNIDCSTILSLGKCSIFLVNLSVKEVNFSNPSSLSLVLSGLSVLELLLEALPPA